MAYFTKDFIDFFKELSANNKKEWFDSNRQRYEKSVKQPFAEFVQEMIDRIRADFVLIPDLYDKFPSRSVYLSSHNIFELFSPSAHQRKFQIDHVKATNIVTLELSFQINLAGFINLEKHPP